MRRVLMSLAAIGLGACTYIYGLDDLAGETPTTDAGSSDGSNPADTSVVDTGNNPVADGGTSDAPFTIDCADSVVGYWPMDEGSGIEVRDRCPNALHGKFVPADGGVSWGTRSDGGCVALTGDAVVSLGKHSQLELAGPFTIAGFVRVDQSVSGFVGIYYNFTGGSTYGAELILDYSGGAYGQIGVADAAVKAELGAIPPGKWRHLAMVFVPNERFEVFLNGASMAKVVPPPGPVAPNPSEVRIGAVFSQVAWTGAIDDVVVYSRALTNDHLVGLSKL